MHPNHDNQLVRLKKVEGQVRGIQTMIQERRYCMDLLSQIRAVTGAMRKIESGILESHLQHCVNDAISSKSKKEAEVKIKEIIRLFEKLN
ncbi:MAG: metal-sensitive transcriptional regulator [SAR324 cluster bacterium]|jgi:DNA-binding FrmR family transcriptional regulator|nr:metal-sensitive transcriptional regulator [SAR324 cluster bacterium]MCH2265086.1 metal-sensitive transcriptional regulator [SAR324 cluster bacterium]|tara:strand:- start:591 stop:860 length:270 start_codon:yes stop_codon:yes gene_type:complete